MTGATPHWEPLRLPDGGSVLATRVDVPAGDPRCGRFMHFHELCELVFYERISGAMWSSRRKFEIADGGLVFVPSMAHHDFEITLDRKRWTMVHFAPAIIADLPLATRPRAFSEPRHVTLDVADRAHVAQLVDWLVSGQAQGASDARQAQILRTILTVYAECADEETSEDVVAGGLGVHRIGPLLDHLRDTPGSTITMPAAASLCHLSPSYFSRYFSAIFGMSFSAYMRLYRLHAAARALAHSDASIGDIADALGFSQPSYLIASFKAQFGLTPRRYRMQHRRAGPQGAG